MAGESLTAGEPRGVSVLPSKPLLNRLTQKDVIYELRQNGRKIVTDHFVLCFLSNYSENVNYAIHIRKRYGSAVERNRAKRVFRVALRQLRERLRGVNLIVTPRRGGKGLGVTQVSPLLEKIFTETSISQQK